MSSLTIILPFFNEEGWIDKTVQTLAIQSDIRFRLLLIDNGSTDNGTEQAREAARSLGSRAEILSCPTPGKIHAMALGLSRVETAFVAICDADTEYPIDYVKRILDLFTGDPEAASVMAIDLYAPLESAESRNGPISSCARADVSRRNVMPVAMPRPIARMPCGQQAASTPNDGPMSLRIMKSCIA